MQIIGVLGFSAFTLVSFAVGLRALALGMRSRQLPELTLGGALVLSGGIGGVLVLLARAGGNSGGEGLIVVATSIMSVGAALLALFTWKVFRPGEAWATALFAGLLGALVLGAVARVLTGETDPNHPGLFTWAGLLTRIAVFAWASGEALREHAAARRRCAIGLTDPLVANRLLLWGVGLGAAFFIWISSAVQLLRHDAEPLWLLTAVLGLTCAGSLWLAFFPPEAYRRRFAPALRGA